MTALWMLCGLMFLSASTRAQTPSLQVGAPASTYELFTTLSASITGTGIYDATPTVRVYDNTTEITSSVTVITLSESTEDSNNDGVLEKYAGEFGIDLGSYQPTPGHLLIVSASATCPGGTTRAASSTKVKSNVDVCVDSKIYEGSSAVHVAVIVNETDVDSQTLTVTFEGENVTSLIGIDGPDLAFELVEGSSPAIVRNRMQVYSLDLSGLEISSDGALAVTASVTNESSKTSTTTATATLVSGTAGTLTECQLAALNAFCASLNLSKNGSGQVSVGATAAQTKTAADTFQAAIALCVPALSTSGAHSFNYTSGGVTYTVKIVTSNSGDAKASGQADVVIALAGDGSGTTAGGDATSTNSQPGGAAVAVGGDGGSGGNIGGNGGSGTANATPPGGEAMGVGGNGGTPSNLNHAGGSGGAGQGNNGATHNGTGGTAGTAGTPGNHGGGGWGNSNDGSGSSGQVGPFPNV
jgi:hypothetical protein